MAKKKVGDLIREARTAAGYTQEQLAKKVAGVSAADISKAERGELQLTQTQLRAVAKATGVTQKSLLDAAGSASSKKPGTTGRKTGSAAGGKTAAAAGRKTSGTTGKKTGSTTVTAANLTATEKKLVLLYRNADSDTKKSVLSILKGEKSQTGALISSLLGSSSVKDAVSGMFSPKKSQD